MEVILLDRITGIGPIGTQAKVKPGFARNYLIPTGKALPATKANIARFESARAELERAAEERLQNSKDRASKLEGFVVIIPAQAGEEGRLFGSVGALDIVQALSDAGHSIAKSEVRLPTGPIRNVGEYEIELHLQGGEVIATIKISVTPQ